MARNRFRIYLRIISGILAVIIGVAGWAYFGRSPGKGLAESIRPVAVSLRLSGPLGAKYAGDIVASRGKLFERNGINVEIREGHGAADPIGSVVGGADTFGVTDSVGFLMARSKGQPIVAFAAGFLEESIVFYALEESGIRAPQDFIGKRIGRRAGTDSAILYDFLLKQAGISRAQIRESATETDLDALLNDRVEVIPGRIGEEGFLLHQRRIPYTVIKVSDYGIHIPDAVYFTTEKFLQDRPSVAQRFLQAIIAGWSMVYADLANSIPLIVPPDGSLTSEQVQFLLLAQRDFVMPSSRRVAEFDEQQWKQLRDILTSARLMDGSVDLKRAVNYEVLKEAYRKPISFGN